MSSGRADHTVVPASLEQRKPQPQFKWIGTATDPSGHADELRGFLRTQEQVGHEPALQELRWTDKQAGLSDAEKAMLRRQTARANRHIDVAVHAYLPWDQNPTFLGAVNVARVMFETDRLPKPWLAPLLRRDELWVPCRHNLEVFADSGIPERKMRIVGGTLDFDLFSPGADPYPLEVEPGRFVFLTNFDFSARKGWETLLAAWGQAFTVDDPVGLVLKTGSFYREEGYVEGRIQSFLQQRFGPALSKLAPVYMLTDLLPTGDMPRLYAAADAYVLASRGEGWGRPYMEAQAMGLPTIASNWGGQLEFMDEDTSWLVDGDLIDVPQNAELFNSLYTGHRWFDPDVDDLAAKLREIASDWGSANERARPARQRLIERFGPEAMANTLRDAALAAMSRFADPARRSYVIRGSFGSAASLATVNDGLAGGLEDVGATVHHRASTSDVVRNPVPGISHSWPHDFSPVTQGPTVMIVPWEYGPPPAEWVREARAKADRVWVPSDYVREQFVAAGMPGGIVEVVPNGFDPARFSAQGPAMELPTRASCVFLFVGGTIWRKGVDLLLAAWEEAFGPEDDVALVVKDFGTGSWYRGQTSQSLVCEYAKRSDIAPIVYLDQEIPARELTSLYRAADVLVAPYRGEGFCLPALEAMACGLPVIHTGTGPTREFVPETGGWALPAREVPVPDHFRLPELTGEAKVQEVDHSGLVATLRDAARDPDNRRARGRSALKASERYTWDAVAERADDLLRTLTSEALPLARLAQPERVERRPDAALVGYAPDWRDGPRWSASLRRWARSFTADDPVTLALLCGSHDADELAGRILEQIAGLGLDEDRLPDLLLCRPDIRLEDLVAAADVVIVDDEDRERRELLRRARRVVASDEVGLAELRRRLPAIAAASAVDAGILAAA
jgi:glycosyltransferase involved in cell wall biosynthesis